MLIDFMRSFGVISRYRYKRLTLVSMPTIHTNATDAIHYANITLRHGTH